MEKDPAPTTEVPEWRSALASEILKEYDGHPDRTRRTVEDEVRRISNPLSASDIETETSDYKQEDGMFDTTVREAKINEINGIMARMFPPSNKWFANKLQNQDPNVAIPEKQIRALEQVGDIQFGQLGQDNFYLAMSEAMHDFLDFGTTNIRLTKGKRRFAFFKAIPKSTYFFQLDDEGFPDIVWNYYRMTAYEIKTRFGEKALPAKIQESLDAKRWDDKFEIINRIQRRDNFSTAPNPSPENREYESLWASKADKDLIGDSSVPRRKVIYRGGENYNIYTIGRLMTRAGQNQGEGITTMMLPAIRLANQKAINIEKAQNLAVDPPWYEDESNPIGAQGRLPGGTINRDPFSPESASAPVPMPSEGMLYEKSGLDEIRNIIKEAYSWKTFKLFTDQDIATNRKTAFETRLMKAEQLALLTTLLYPLAEEIVKPLLTKHLQLMVTNGKIPRKLLDDLPEDYEIELTSQFAKSIESTQAEDLMTASEMAIQLEQVDPGVARSTVKFNQAFRKVLLNMEIAVDDLYTDAESKDLIQAERDAQAAALQAQTANQGADAISKVAGIT
jgi:hypothetical protein